MTPGEPYLDDAVVLANLRRLRRRAPGLVDGVLGRWAEAVVSEMKDEAVVPRDTGRLRDSHGWRRVGPGRYELFANTGYAAAVHERHPTKARWFARVLATRARGLLGRAVEEIRRRLEGGGA